MRRNPVCCEPVYTGEKKKLAPSRAASRSSSELLVFIVVFTSCSGAPESGVICDSPKSPPCRQAAPRTGGMKASLSRAR
jgi:hypothetical protein